MSIWIPRRRFLSPPDECLRAYQRLGTGAGCGMGGGYIPTDFKISDLSDVANYWAVDTGTSVSGGILTGWTSDLGYKSTLAQSNGPYRPRVISNAWTKVGPAGFTVQVGSSYMYMTALYSAGQYYSHPSTFYFVYKGLDPARQALFSYSSDVQWYTVRAGTGVSGSPYVESSRLITLPNGLDEGEHVWCIVQNGASSAIYIDNATTPVATGDLGSGLQVHGMIMGATQFELPTGIYGDILTCKTVHDQVTRTKVMNLLKSKFVGAFSPIFYMPEYWYDPADDYTTEVSGKVSTWVKRAGTGSAQLAQATAGNRPTRSTDAGGRRVLGFAQASQQYLIGTSTFTAGTIFVVAKYAANTFAGYTGLLDDTASNNAWFVGEDATTNFFPYSGITHYLDGTQTLAAAPNAWHVYELTSGWTNSYTMQVGRDGSFVDRCWNGQVADIVSYKPILSAAARLSIRSYLGAKYGVTVS